MREEARSALARTSSDNINLSWPSHALEAPVYTTALDLIYSTQNFSNKVTLTNRHGSKEGGNSMDILRRRKEVVKGRSHAKRHGLAILKD